MITATEARTMMYKSRDTQKVIERLENGIEWNAKNGKDSCQIQYIDNDLINDLQCYFKKNGFQFQILERKDMYSHVCISWKD